MEAVNYCLGDTIYALSSGLGKGGVAVVRVSGNQVTHLLKKLASLSDPVPRHAYFRPVVSDGVTIDQALILFFKGPNSFTGEDVAEFQIHGGRAVIQGLMEALGNQTGCRPAERGEFSRRAVINGKMDLTEAEGLLDLIHAETERQRQMALAQMRGSLGHQYEKWRQELIHNMAYLEAFIDFPEEEIPPEKEQQINKDITRLIEQINSHLNDQRVGQKLREGYQIAIIGAPNVGKSSLINALTHKDVAIVSQVAGTTRDVVEAHLDVSGFPVVLADTAGLRAQADEIEAEGMRRAVQKAGDADLILNVQDGTLWPTEQPLPKTLTSQNILTVWNKVDLMKTAPEGLTVSAKTGQGITELWARIQAILERDFGKSTDAVITRERYRVALKTCVDCLNQSLQVSELELKAEELRLAARSLGRITGRIEAEDLLDVIFRDFCIGK